MKLEVSPHPRLHSARLERGARLTVPAPVAVRLGIADPEVKIAGVSMPLHVDLLGRPDLKLVCRPTGARDRGFVVRRCVLQLVLETDAPSPSVMI